jgi:hypothetical protein
MLGEKPTQTNYEREIIMKLQCTWTEAHAEGRLEGRLEGRAHERASAVLTVLRVRGVTVPKAARRRVLAQKDLPRLERWLEKAITATSITEVLDDPS